MLSKKILAFLVVVFLLISTLCISAFAAGKDDGTLFLEIGWRDFVASQGSRFLNSQIAVYSADDKINLWATLTWDMYITGFC